MTPDIAILLAPALLRNFTFHPAPCNRDPTLGRSALPWQIPSN